MTALVVSLLAAAAAPAAPPAAAPSGARTIAISYFDNTADDPALDPLRKGLADMLITDLSGVGALRIVEREKLEALVREIKLGRGRFFDPATAQKLGRGLGAEFVLTGAYLVQGEKLRIDARVVRVETGEVVVARKAEGEKADFFVIEKELVELLVGALDVKVERAEKRALSRHATESFEAVRRYSEGLDARDRGDEEAAAKAFRAALEADPQYAAAKSAVERLRVILRRADEATAGDLAELASWRDRPDFPRRVNDLLLRIGYDFDPGKVRQRIAVLRFLAENDLRPNLGTPPTNAFVEIGHLSALAAGFAQNPDFADVVPAVLEYLHMKYPGDATLGAFSMQLRTTEERLAKLAADRARVAEAEASVAAGMPFVRADPDAPADDGSCRWLWRLGRDFGDSCRLLQATTGDTARIAGWADRFLAWLARERAARCRGPRDSPPGDDLFLTPVVMAFASLGDRPRMLEYADRAGDGRKNIPVESLESMVRMQAAYFENRAAMQALVDVLRARAAAR